MDLPAHELLRQGSAHVEYQDRRGYGVRLDAVGQLHACALGAIAVALKGLPDSAAIDRTYVSDVRDQYLRILLASPSASPDCPGRGPWPWQGHYDTCARVAGLANQVAHLNDRHGWSFERIADWLQREHADWRLAAESEDAGVRTVPNAASAVAAAEEIVRLLAEVSEDEGSLAPV